MTMRYPSMFEVHQQFATNPITDVTEAVRRELDRLAIDRRIQPGQTVAITAGSRGIDNIVQILAAIVDRVCETGARPFLVPAMGSHGGATAEGQIRVLAGYGITEESIGAPIVSSLDVVELGISRYGLPVYFDKTAFHADHVVVVNRIKPHTDFKAPIESGLMKMMVVGLGKQKGAEQYHNSVLQYGYYESMLACHQVIMTHAPISFGIGIIEDQLEETTLIRGGWRDDLEAMEIELQATAKKLLPRLPVSEIDLLIVDEMGKDISGTCMDQNVIARTVIRVGSVPSEPRIRRIFVRELTENSHGTATGIGNADFTTTRLVEKINRDATYMNCLSACEPEMASIPPYFDSDREAIERAMLTIGLTPSHEAKIVQIRNTLDLAYFRVSEPLLGELQAQPDIKIMAPTGPLRFDATGNLLDQWHPRTKRGHREQPAANSGAR